MTTNDKHISTKTGIVTRISGNQTVRVVTKLTKTHPIYRKRYTQLKHIIAHDENNTAKVGDEVTIKSCRPISKTKSWTIVTK